MQAFLTVQAVVTVIHDLYSGELGLRIGAPFAAKGAALQKNRGPDAGTVMDRKLLNVKNDTFHIVNSLLPAVLSARHLRQDSGPGTKTSRA